MRRILVVFCVGCGASVTPQKSVAPPVVPQPPPRVEPARPVVPLRIEVTSDDKVENCIHVNLHFAGKLASSAGRNELHVQYALKFAPSSGAGAPFSESIELQVAGEDLFALPASEENLDVALDVETGNTVTGGASSFGIGHARTFSARLEELRGAFLIGGDVGTAEFHAGDGDDITA